MKTRWSANWDSQDKLVSGLGTNWADDFYVWSMEWTSQFIYHYIDDIFCSGNMFTNNDFETGDLANWTGWALGR